MAGGISPNLILGGGVELIINNLHKQQVFQKK